MKFSTRVIIGICAIIGIFAIYFADNYYQQKRNEKENHTTTALYFKTQDISKIYIKNNNGIFIFQRSKNMKDWTIELPKKELADQDSINNVLTSISQIQVQKIIPEQEVFEDSANSKDKLSNFGLNYPQMEISVTDFSGKTITLNLGSKLNLGSSKTNALISNSIYGKRSSDNSLLILDNSILTTIFEKRFQDFRTKYIFNFDGTKTAEIAFSSKTESFILKKIGTNWSIVSPYQLKADDNFINSYLSTVQGLMAQTIYDNSPQNLSKFNLQYPSATIIFKDVLGHIQQSILTEVTPSGVYTTTASNTIAQLNLNIWPDLIPSLNHFQDKQVMIGVDLSELNAIELTKFLSIVRQGTNWFIKNTNIISKNQSSVANNFVDNWSFLTASSIIMNTTKNTLAQYGINSPIKTFTLFFKKSSNRSPIKIIIGNRVPYDEKSVYLKRSDLSQVFIIDTGWFHLLDQLYTAAPIDP